MEKEVTIPNWTFFGAKNVAIDVAEVIVDGEVYYNPMVTLFLEDGTDEEKAVSIITDHYCTDAKGSVYEIARHLAMMFDSISANVTHFDSAGDIVEEYNLNEDFDQYNDFEIEMGDKPDNKPVKATIH